MKKAVIILASFGGFMLLIYVLARITHCLAFYSITGESNRPTFSPGDRIVASCLKSPNHNDFVCYKNNLIEGDIYVHRCIGLPGDVIEIKDNDVYVNHVQLNEAFTWNNYVINKQQENSIEGYIQSVGYPIYKISDTTSCITLSKIDLSKYHLELKKYITPRDTINYNLYQQFKKADYSVSNFGPVTVPPNCYFVLGDNRQAALDSRYAGFIKKNEIVATVLGDH